MSSDDDLLEELKMGPIFCVLASNKQPEILLPVLIE